MCARDIVPHKHIWPHKHILSHKHIWPHKHMNGWTGRVRGPGLIFANVPHTDGTAAHYELLKSLKSYIYPKVQRVGVRHQKPCPTRLD